MITQEDLENIGGYEDLEDGVFVSLRKEFNQNVVLENPLHFFLDRNAWREAVQLHGVGIDLNSQIVQVFHGVVGELDKIPLFAIDTPEKLAYIHKFLYADNTSAWLNIEDRTKYGFDREINSNKEGHQTVFLKALPENSPDLFLAFSDDACVAGVVFPYEDDEGKQAVNVVPMFGVQSRFDLAKLEQILTKDS